MSRNFEFNPEMYKIVAKNVRKYRKEKNLTIDELCKYAEIKKEFLQNFELAKLGKMLPKEKCMKKQELLKLMLYLLVFIKLVHLHFYAFAKY